MSRPTRYLTLCLTALAFSALAVPVHAAGTIPTARGPVSVLANPIRHEVYVANIYADAASIVDARSETAVAQISIPPEFFWMPSRPTGLAHNPNTGRLYVTNPGSGRLAVIRLQDRVLETKVMLASGSATPRAVVVDPITDTAYVADANRNVVYAVDGDPLSVTFNRVVATIGVRAKPSSAAIDANLGQLYVVNTLSNDVSVIDIDPASPTFHRLIATIGVAQEPFAIALNQSTGKAYVGNRGTTTVAVIDTTSNTVQRYVRTGAAPNALDVNEERNLVYVGNRDDNTVAVIDGETDEVKVVVPAGSKPWAIACVKGSAGDAFIANYGAGAPGSVTAIRPDFSTAPTPAGVFPASVSVDALLTTPKAFVANLGSDTLTVIDSPTGESSLVTAIDSLPGDATDVTTPVMTGTSHSQAAPRPHKIIQVYCRVDAPDGEWHAAEIVDGRGTATVRWRVAITDPLPEGGHAIEAVALDVTGATLTSIDGNANTPATGQVASYEFTVGEKAPVVGEINGTLFDDSDGNGERDASEGPLVGWTVVLTLSDGSHAEATTDADGAYRFQGLPPGAHAVREVVKANWRATTPDEVKVELAAGETRHVDFGNIELGWIRGTVRDEYTNEPCAGVLVSLAGLGRTAATDALGAYCFDELAPSGTVLRPDAYVVEISLPDGYRSHSALQQTVVVNEGATSRADFRIYRTAWSAGTTPRGVGYWKNWRNHYDGSELGHYLSLAQAASGMFGDLSTADVNTFLSPGGKTSMQRKAEGHLLVAWLNVVSGKLGLDVQVDLRAVAGWSRITRSGPQMTVADLLRDVGGVISANPGKATCETAKNVLEALNEGALF